MTTPSTRANVVILGGGAAGLMCAIEAGKRGRTVVLLEHQDRIGKKILISGGGRCNFTNLHASPENYLSQNPDFCKSALARYTPYDFIDLVEKHNLPYHEKKLGQLFCNQSSRQILDLLERECAQARVKFMTSCKIQAIRKPGDFEIETNLGIFSCPSLVIATGGLSFPQLGATSFGYEIARQFGLKVVDCKPGLVPLTMESSFKYSSLSGISLNAEVRCLHQKFRENILFTHRGLSGPAILQISSYWKPGSPLELDLLPDALPFDQAQLPKRFLAAFRNHIPGVNPKPMSPPEIQELTNQLHHWNLQPHGTEGYPKAEVTVGGVDTSELSSKTMEARSVPGLYFIGEVVDVTGWLGGYNFQWAWASGHAAGQVA